jgi:hypothetical protein
LKRFIAAKYSCLFLVVAADLHLLAGQMVAGQVELQLGVAGVFAVGEAAHNFLERFQRLARSAFWSRPTSAICIVVVQRLQVIGIGDIAVARVELDEPVGGDQRVVVFVAF